MNSFSFSGLTTLVLVGCVWLVRGSDSDAPVPVAVPPSAGEPATNQVLAQPTIAANPFDERLRLLTEASSLIGRKVRDPEDRSLGKIRDVIVNLASGQTVGALISCGRATESIPVPAASFLTVRRDKAVINLGKKLFERAPRISSTHSGGWVEANSLDESFDYFGQKRPAKGATIAQFRSSSSLVGMPVLAQDNQSLGTVMEVMVDLPRGQVIYLIIEPAGLGTQNHLYYAVPPAVVELRPSATAFGLRASQAHFRAGPSFEKEFPTEVTAPEFAWAVYKHYALPRGPVAVDGPGVSEKREVESQSSSAQIGQVRSGQQIAQAVLVEIMREPSASGVQGLIVTSAEGRIVLAGRVKGEAQALEIVTAAERVAGAGKVENRLQTRSGKAINLPGR